MALAPILLILVLAGMYFLRTKRSRSCRWRQNVSAGGYRCASCGAAAPGVKGGEPRFCHAPKKPEAEK